MLDASGRALGAQLASGGAATWSTRALPADVVAALTGLPRRALRDLAAAGAIEAADATSEHAAAYRAGATVAAAAHVLLVGLGVDSVVAAALVRPASAPPEHARAAAAARRLLAGAGGRRELVAEVEVLPAAHLVSTRSHVAAGGRWDAAAHAHAELSRFVRLHEMTTTGPVAVTVTDVAEAEIGIEVSVPVEELVGSSGDVHPGHRAAQQVAVARHDGDPLTSAVTGEALWWWIADQGLEPTGLPIEVHVAADRVDLCWPVR